MPFGDGTQALPAILALNYRRWPDEVKLVFENSKAVHPFDWHRAVLNPAVANYAKSPLHGKTKNGSAVEARKWAIERCEMQNLVGYDLTESMKWQTLNASP